MHQPPQMSFPGADFEVEIVLPIPSDAGALRSFVDRCGGCLRESREGLRETAQRAQQNRNPNRLGLVHAVLPFDYCRCTRYEAPRACARRSRPQARWLCAIGPGSAAIPVYEAPSVAICETTWTRARPCRRRVRPRRRSPPYLLLLGIDAIRVYRPPVRSDVRTAIAAINAGSQLLVTLQCDNFLLLGCCQNGWPRIVIARGRLIALATSTRIQMNYTLLIYENSTGFGLRTDPEKAKAYWAQWPAYSKALKDAGIMVGGAGLEPPVTATKLQMKDG